MSDQSMESGGTRMSELDCAYFDGLLSVFDDLADGAYQAACEQTIRWSEKEQR